MATDETHPENLLIMTRQGFLVRSRVEALIADVYFDKGVIVEYEAPLYVGNGMFIKPDFTLHLDAVRSLRFHEHAGMFNDPDYRSQLKWKLTKYMEAGFRIGKDVLLTYDDDYGKLDMDGIARAIDLFVSMS
ncbi:MAG: hypothetical protein IIY88_07330 [Eubacterium sp.]|nr:hypothetical protein [Eubacterium sp.]